MTGMVTHGQWGLDWARVVRTLSGPEHRPFMRPQINPYGETTDPRDYAWGNRQPAIVRALMGGEIEYHPEVENHSYTPYAKSARMTRMQMTILHLDGFHQTALNAFYRVGPSLAEGEILIRALEQHRGFFEALEAAIPEGTRNDGIACLRRADGHLHRRVRPGETALSELIYQPRAEGLLPLLGLPVGFRWENSPFLLLGGDDAAALKPGEIETLLRRNPVLDRRAVECILGAGLGDVLGFSLGDEIPHENCTYERFDGEGYEAVPAGRLNPLRGSFPGNWCRRIHAAEETRLDAESWVVSALDEQMCPAVARVTTGGGRRYGILNFAIDECDRLMFLNPARPLQMRRLFEWTAGTPLPVVVEKAPMLMPQLVPLPDGSRILGLSNFRTPYLVEVEVTPFSCFWWPTKL